VLASSLWEICPEALATRGQIIQNASGEKDQAGSEGVRLCMKVFFHKPKLYQRVQDGMSFALMNLHLPEDVCESPFLPGTFSQTEENFGRLFDGWNQGFVRGDFFVCLVNFPRFRRH
jgi:hypothetical protein